MPPRERWWKEANALHVLEENEKQHGVESRNLHFHLSRTFLQTPRGHVHLPLCLPSCNQTTLAVHDTNKDSQHKQGPYVCVKQKTTTDSEESLRPWKITGKRERHFLVVQKSIATFSWPIRSIEPVGSDGHRVHSVPWMGWKIERMDDWMHISCYSLVITAKEGSLLPWLDLWKRKINVFFIVITKSRLNILSS